jgi:hypothetical protein
MCRAQREAILDTFEASGKSGQALALQHGIKIKPLPHGFKNAATPVVTTKKNPSAKNCACATFSWVGLRVVIFFIFVRWCDVCNRIVPRIVKIGWCLIGQTHLLAFGKPSMELLQLCHGALTPSAWFFVVIVELGWQLRD